APDAQHGGHQRGAAGEAAFTPASDRRPQPGDGQALTGRCGGAGCGGGRSGRAARRDSSTSRCCTQRWCAITATGTVCRADAARAGDRRCGWPPGRRGGFGLTTAFAEDAESECEYASTRVREYASTRVREYARARECESARVRECV